MEDREEGRKTRYDERENGRRMEGKGMDPKRER